MSTSLEDAYAVAAEVSSSCSGSDIEDVVMAVIVLGVLCRV
jgi:hypothetical protein